MEFRLIVMKAEDAFTQMAIDEVILNGVIEKSSPPTIRFFNFHPPSITIGRLQKIEEINIKKCSGLGIDVVRRITGGRAVIHFNDFTFSFIFHRDNSFLSGSIYETYKTISSLFHRALQSLGITAEFHKVKMTRKEKGKVSSSNNPFCFSAISRYELTINKEKVLGISQYRKKDAILVQGTLLLEELPELYSDLFITSVSLGGFSHINGFSDKEVSFDTFSATLKRSLMKDHQIHIYQGLLSDEERQRTDRVVKKFKSPVWNNWGRLVEKY